MNRKLIVLKQLDLFKSLPQEELEYLAGHLISKEYSKRQVILEPVDKDKIFILKSGKVEFCNLIGCHNAKSRPLSKNTNSL